MKHLTTCMAVIAMFLLTNCTTTPKAFTIKFDSNKEISGKKFAVHDINPDCPAIGMITILWCLSFASPPRNVFISDLRRITDTTSCVS